MPPKQHATGPRVVHEMRGKAQVLEREERRRGRLTDQERADRKLTGGELQRQITDLATIFGWSWCHWRALKNGRGFWQVPVEGPLGEGWPDLFLAHPVKQRVLLVEVKRELGDPLTAAQVGVHQLLRHAGLEVEVWRPSDMTAGTIQAALA
jgi:hypothetical protein